MSKIILLNRKYTDNLGDIAIGDSLRHLLTDRGHEVYHLEYSTFGMPISWFTSQESKRSQMKGVIRSLYRLLSGKLRWFVRSGFRLLLQLRKVPRDIDLIIIGGGQLINSEPYNDQFAYAFDLWNRVNRYRFKTRLAVFAVGAGSHFTPYARRAFTRGFQEADVIYVRDDRSKQILQNLSDNLNVKTVPDVAFAYSDVIPLSREVASKGKTALVGIYDYETYVTINETDMSREAYYDKWNSDIVRLEADGYVVILFYSTGRDKIETESFARTLNLNHTIVNAETVSDLIQSLCTTDLVYSGRMHALILALVYGCKIQVFPTSDKLRTFACMYADGGEKELIEQINHELDQVLSNGTL